MNAIRPEPFLVFEQLQLLKPLCEYKHPNDYVFTRADGSPVRTLRNVWEQVTERAGVPVMIHDLRRTAIRNMVRSGISETVAMQISGHKDRTVFNRYNVTSEGDLRKAAETIEAFQRANFTVLSQEQQTAVSQVC